MLVEDAMTEDVVACDISVSLDRAVERMLRRGVGSVVVRREGIPIGIVTETDVLHAGYAAEKPFSKIPVGNALSSPLVTISPQKTLRRATQRMKNEEIKKLVVVDDLDLVGILTTADIVHNYGELKAELGTLADPTAKRSRLE